MQLGLERRAHHRRVTAIIAALKLDVGEEIPCVVRDVSPGGAKIGVPARYKLPDQFNVMFRTSGRSMRVRLVWRKGDFIGVAIKAP